MNLFHYNKHGFVKIGRYKAYHLPSVGVLDTGTLVGTIDTNLFMYECQIFVFSGPGWTVVVSAATSLSFFKMFNFPP